MPKTPERNNEIRELSRQKIRDAALHQFARKGLFATRIQDIAKEAGISQGLLYRYYSSKDEIFTDLVEAALDKINEASMQMQKMDMKADKKLELALEELARTIEKSEGFRQTSRLITQAMNSSAISMEVQRLLEEKRDVPYRALARIMAQGQSENSVVEGDPYDLAILFWSTVNGLTMYAATRQGIQTLPDMGPVLSMFLRHKEVRP